jgi:hypothetical protein
MRPQPAPCQTTGHAGFSLFYTIKAWRDFYKLYKSLWEGVRVDRAARQMGSPGPKSALDALRRWPIRRCRHSPSRERRRREREVCVEQFRHAGIADGGVAESWRKCCPKRKTEASFQMPRLVLTLLPVSSNLFGASRVTSSTCPRLTVNALRINLFPFQFYL